MSLLLISFPVLALSTKSQGKPAQAQEETAKTQEVKSLPDNASINAVQNRLRQETQNQAEDIKLQIKERVRTQEQLQTMEPDQAREMSEKAQENMSEVAKKVHELLQDPERFGGIGEQVRVIAQNQNEAQNRLENHYEQLQNRAGFVKMLFGADQNSIEGIKEVITENEGRLAELIELKDSAETVEEAEELDSMIEAISEQNLSLLQQTIEEDGAGLFKGILRRFGALFKFGTN